MLSVLAYRHEKLEKRMKVLALDAMGVTYKAGDDVAELLVPFVTKRSEVSVSRIEELYHQCSLGEFSSSVFWERLELSTSIEDEYLANHRLVNGVKEFIADARANFDSIWCLSNDISEWSIKLRQMFALESIFDGFVISGDIKSRKPSPESYKALFAASNANPEDILFIDDRPKNVLAAINHGMKSILFGKQSEPTNGLEHAHSYSNLRNMTLLSSQPNVE
ncbi:MAG: hypothetical protein DRQ48_08695 [Gammaproteobacteria bacterium]|nr:MAG: hypothetical protein DRQ48_08695 [Gammaproteobacteria bacterium]